MNETEKSVRFKRLAAKRTNDVLERLRILGNCSDRRGYSYTEEEVNKIFKAIDDQVRLVKSRFKVTKKSFRL